MSLINKVAQGFFNELMNKETETHTKRMVHCKQCKLLYHDSLFGETCNSELYVNPKTGEVSTTDRPGFKNGCGCIIRSKTRVPDAHCPLGK